MKKNNPETNNMPATSESRMYARFDIRFFSNKVMNQEARDTLLCKIWYPRSNHDAAVELEAKLLSIAGSTLLAAVLTSKLSTAFKNVESSVCHSGFEPAPAVLLSPLVAVDPDGAPRTEFPTVSADAAAAAKAAFHPGMHADIITGSHPPYRRTDTA